MSNYRFYKRFLWFIVLMSSGLEANEITLDQVIQAEFGFSGDQLVYLITRRYYFIQRLSSAFTILKEFQQHAWPSLTNAQRQNLVTIADSITFSNSVIKLNALRMKHSKNLYPLFEVWDSIVHFQCIQDEDLLTEFVHLAFLISRNAFEVTMKHSKKLHVTHTQDILCAEQEAEFIDLLCQGIKDHNMQQEVIELFNKQPLETVTIHEVMSRFYQLKRLTTAVKAMHQVAKKRSALTYLEHNEGITCNNIQFTDSAVCACIKEVGRSGTVKPFITLLRDFESYKFIHNTNRLKEMLLLLCILYREVLFSDAHKNKNHKVDEATLQLITEMYEQLPNLSVEEIMDSIDILTTQVGPVLEHYEFNADISWRVWLKKYWWLPPTLVMIITTQLYIKAMQARKAKPAF